MLLVYLCWFCVALIVCVSKLCSVVLVRLLFAVSFGCTDDLTLFDGFFTAGWLLFMAGGLFVVGFLGWFVPCVL